MPPLRENDLTKKRPVSTVRLPLKAETETIGVKQEKLLHAVWRNFGLFHVDSLGTQVRVDSINVGSSEETPGVAVRSRAARVGSRRPLIVLVSRIKHKIYIIQPKPDPVVIWRSRVPVRLHDLEPQDVAIELQGSRHVEDLKQWCHSSDIHGHGNFQSPAGKVRGASNCNPRRVICETKRQLKVSNRPRRFSTRRGSNFTCLMPGQTLRARVNHRARE